MVMNILYDAFQFIVARLKFVFIHFTYYISTVYALHLYK